MLKREEKKTNQQVTKEHMLWKQDVKQPCDKQMEETSFKSSEETI